MTSMTISLSRGVGSLRFNKSSVGGQAAIEFILFAVMLIIAFAFLIMTYLDNGGFRGGRDSPDVELTQTGTIEGKYIDSAGFSKSYYVTVRNGSHHADHEVSLAEYNAAAVGADFPGWGYFIGPFVATLLWIPATFVLLLPQSRPVEQDPNRPI